MKKEASEQVKQAVAMLKDPDIKKTPQGAVANVEGVPDAKNPPQGAVANVEGVMDEKTPGGADDDKPLRGAVAKIEGVEVHALAVTLRMIPRAVIKAAVKAGAVRDEKGRLWMGADVWGAFGKLLLKGREKVATAATAAAVKALRDDEEWMEVRSIPPNRRLVFVMRVGRKPPSSVIAMVRRQGVVMGDEVVVRSVKDGWEVL